MAALILFAALAAAMPADHDGPVPSFDCHRATSHVELMICGDAVLSSMDRGIALFYASGRRNARPARVIREQPEWLRMRNGCETVACLRENMTARLWQLAEGVGPDLPLYADEDADSELVIADLGGGWYAFGANGSWHGPTENSAEVAGAFHLEGNRGSIAPASDDECSFSLDRLPNDRWRITAHPNGETTLCGGMNATVEGTYSRRRHR